MSRVGHQGRAGCPAEWLGAAAVAVLGLAACVEQAPRPPACVPPALVPYTGAATIPTADTAPAGPYVWDNAVIKGGGFVSGIVVSTAMPGLRFARTDVGGAYRFDPVKQRWWPVTDWVGRADSNLTGIESIALDPVDPNRVYIAAGQYLTAGAGMILASTDMGRTWARYPIPAPMGGNVDGRSMGERLVVDPNLPSTLYFGSRNAGLFRSTDSAVTWVPAGFPITGAVGGGTGAGGSGYGLSFVAFDPASGTPGSATPHIYVGVGLTTGDTLYRSTDAGATWAPVTGGPPGMMPHHAVADGCGNLFLVYNNGSGPNGITAGGVWRLAMATGEWQEITPRRSDGSPLGGGGWGGIAVDPTRQGTLIATTIDRWSPDEIYRTSDGGATWMAMGPGSQRDTAGATWLYWHGSSPTSTGWMGDVEIDPFSPSRALYVTGQGIWSSDDVNVAGGGGQSTWKFDNDGLEETVPLDLASPPEGAPLLSGVGDISGFRHDDLGVSPPDGMFSAPIFGNTRSLDFAEKAPSIVVRVGTSSGQSAARGAYSTDGGNTWSAFAAAPMGSSATAMPSEGTIAVSADGSTFVWAPRSGVMSYSRNRGAAWTACAIHAADGTALANLTGNNVRVASDRVNAMKLYVTSGSRIYVSTDGGATFTQQAAAPQGTPGPNGKPRPVFGVEGDLWVAVSAGLLRSQDSGATFQPVPGISNATSVGFGMPAPGSTYPAVYAAALLTATATWGIYRSDDAGASWTRVDDPQHQFGFINVVTGDPRKYGRVYLGTGGRGIVFGDPATSTSTN